MFNYYYRFCVPILYMPKEQLSSQILFVIRFAGAGRILTHYILTHSSCTIIERFYQLNELALTNMLKFYCFD